MSRVRLIDTKGEGADPEARPEVESDGTHRRPLAPPPRRRVGPQRRRRRERSRSLLHSIFLLTGIFKN